MRKLCDSATDSRSVAYYQKFHADLGCEVAPSCLACPLPACKHDDPTGYQRWRRQLRDRRIVSQMEKQGLSIQRAALSFQVTERTIFRIIARMRQEVHSGLTTPAATAAGTAEGQ